MGFMNYVKASCFWLGFLAVAVTFGIIRDKILTPGLGPLGGRASAPSWCASVLLG
jgi:hypothetical protein